MRILSYLLPLILLSALHAQSSRNVLIIVADDLGVDYVGAYKEGTSPPPTPNIDALANRGVLFRNTWANPSCSPTRACITTGRYPFRTFVGRWIRHLNNSEPIGTIGAHEWTLPEVLDRAQSGYAHACVGKWHINDHSFGNDAPRTMGGFSHFAGSLEGQIPSYTNWTRVVNGNAQKTTTYCTTQNTNDALAWIGSQTKPWMLYLTYQAPHIPYHAPPAHLHTQNLAGLTPQSKHTSANRPFYRAMVESLDTEIGRLLTQLGSQVLSNTNIIFIGDNGSVQKQAVAPFDLNRAKGTPYEGGVNVPLIIAGPDVVTGGREVKALACAVDVFATALELAGAQTAVPSHVVYDSLSLVPYLKNPTQVAVRQFAFTEQFTGNVWPKPNQNGHATIRDDRYKLIHYYTRGDEFFDLLLDPWENKNLLSGTLTSAQQSAHVRLINEIARLRTPSAQFAIVGKSSCQGSAGVPSIATQGSPKIAATYTVEVHSAPLTAPAVMTFGLSMETWGALSLPFDLASIGAGPGCLVFTSGDASTSLTTSATGSASVSVAVPNQLSLVGRVLFHSWLLVDTPGAQNPIGVLSTSAVGAIVGL